MLVRTFRVEIEFETGERYGVTVLGGSDELLAFAKAVAGCDLVHLVSIANVDDGELVFLGV